MGAPIADRVRALAALRRPDAVVLEVRDNGGGDANGATQHDGHGLIGMRERAAALGGTFEAGAAPGGGFRVRAVLPTAKASE